MSYTITNLRAYALRIPPDLRLAPGEAITMPDAYDVGKLAQWIQDQHITITENGTGGGGVTAFTYFGSRINFNSTAEQAIVPAQAGKIIHVPRLRLYNTSASVITIDVMDATTAEGSPAVLETIPLAAGGGIVLAFEDSPAYYTSQLSKSFVLKASLAGQIHGRLTYRVA
jgi:hypothetical protein